MAKLSPRRAHRGRGFVGGARAARGRRGGSRRDSKNKGRGKERPGACFPPPSFTSRAKRPCCFAARLVDHLFFFFRHERGGAARRAREPASFPSRSPATQRRLTSQLSQSDQLQHYARLAPPLHETTRRARARSKSKSTPTSKLFVQSPSLSRARPPACALAQRMPPPTY